MARGGAVSFAGPAQRLFRDLPNVFCKGTDKHQRPTVFSFLIADTCHLEHFETISIKINCMDTELHMPYPIGSIKSVGWNVCKFPVLTETHCILETYEWMAWVFFCLFGFFLLKDSFKMLYFLSFLLPPFLSVSSVFFSIKSLQLSFKSNLSEFSRGDTEERKPKGRKKMCFCCGFFRLLVFLSLMPAL